MKFPIENLPKEEIVIVETKRAGCLPGNSLAICPHCKRKHYREDFTWRCKGHNTYSGQLLWN